MAKSRKNCPECDSDEFISEPNRYDVFQFEDGDFEIIDSHFIDEFKTFCRECSEEIDVQLSIQKKRVMLKK
ncbi:MAG: hypothetical protein ACR2N3_01890 [Pyrinomonadaceae bacterium]